MTATLVCGKYPLELLPGSGGHYAYLNTVSQKNAACFEHLIAGLPRVSIVVEYFGGVGQFSTILQQVCRPGSHYAFDLDPDCVRQLESIPGVRASQGDAKQTMGTIAADLVVLDFAYATIKHHDEWPWDRVFAKRPERVIWSDTAARRIGLHRDLYSKIFGTPIVSNEDYFRAYSKFVWARYGYSVTRVAHHQYSYLLAEPTPYSDRIEITKVSSATARINEDHVGPATGGLRAASAAPGAGR